MKKIKIYILGFIVAFIWPAQAQKTIVISDSLTAHAEKFTIKMGSLWMGKIKNFGFGDYAMVSSKVGATTGTSNSNLFNTQTESTLHKKFEFVLINKPTETDSARVYAGAHNAMVQSLRKIALGNGWSVGNDEMVESNNFTALITINRDTSETWALFMGGTSLNGVGNYQAYLTNGKRKVLLALASSIKEIQYTSAWNAVGYEFFENGRSLCALQYYGFGKSPNIVWLDNRLDAKFKLVLASAMTSVWLVSSPLSPIQ
jgi:hypothetical protein